MFFLGHSGRGELKPTLVILKANVGFLMFVIKTLAALAPAPDGLECYVVDTCIMLISNSAEASNTIAIDAYVEFCK